MFNHPKLEVLSWIAGIVGTVVALITAVSAMIPNADRTISPPAQS
jgi:hypothetical protein